MQAQKGRLRPKAVTGFGQLVQAPVTGGDDAPVSSPASPPVPAQPGGPASGEAAQLEQAQSTAPASGGLTPVQPHPEPEPGLAAGGLEGDSAAEAEARHHKMRTSDMVPLKVKAKVEADQKKKGMEASTVIVLAFSQALKDGCIPDLVTSYRNRGSQPSPFGGPHIPARQSRGTATTRLQYNPWDYEDEGIKLLVDQYGVSRAVLVSLVLAHYYGLDPSIV